MKKILKLKNLFLICFSLLLVSSCSKDDYYEDGGRAQAEFDGSILDYLETKPVLFDTIVEIIKLAGLEETFRNEEFTFFSPADQDIKDIIGTNRTTGVNNELFRLGLDTITKLSDIDSTIWRKHLMKYMFKGKNRLEDYPQVDFTLLGTFPGQNYIAYSGNITNIGVVFNDVIQRDGNGNEISRLKYKGYRQLYISNYLDNNTPTLFGNYPIATSDIQPHNGILHVLDYTKAFFGFNQGSFYNDVIQSKY